MRAHLKLARKIYGNLNHKSGFKDFKTQGLPDTEFLLPIYLSLGYKAIFKIFTELTGSIIVSDIGGVMSCENPGLSLINQRNTVMPDHYLLTINKASNKIYHGESAEYAPRNTVLNLFEYIVLDIVSFLEKKQHLDEVLYYTGSSKEHEPHTVCLGTSFTNAEHHCYPKVYHHNKMLMIGLHKLATNTPTHYRTFKTPVITPKGDIPEIA